MSVDSKLVVIFRDNLALVIKQRGLTQEKCADLCGISQPYLNRLLCGKQVPSLDMCDQIANALGVPASVMMQEDSIRKIFATAS